MYVNCEIEISVGKEKRLIVYLIGIQQGCNIARVSIYVALESV
jgi:hypothetical protein